jgi:ribosome-associated protein
MAEPPGTDQAAGTQQLRAPVSKTRRKREMQARQDLGEQLVELSAARLAALRLPERLLDAVLQAKRISKFGALRRQLQYVGRLMREVDVTPIEAQLELWRGQSRQTSAYLHRIERWRERLLASDDALDALARAHPGRDLARARTLVEAARRERALSQPPTSYRALFLELKTIVPQQPEADQDDGHQR